MYSIKTLYKIGHGPSSSHTMGPEKAAEYILEKYHSSNIKKVTVHLYGSLALTGKGHLTDSILDLVLKDVDHDIKFEIQNFDKYTHPNTMVFNIDTLNGSYEEIIYSIGGGYIKVEGEKSEEYPDVYPHKYAVEINAICKENKWNLFDYIVHYEPDILDYMEHIYQVMMATIDNGLKKTGVLPGNLHVQRKALEIYSKKVPYENEMIKEKRTISAYAFATSEENASGGLIVTAPTCGACGILPALVRYSEECGYDHKEVLKGLAVAGLAGMIIKTNGSISGAECGCQAEVGSACSMGAAMMSYLFNKEDNDSVFQASEIALEHHLGLTCDPVEGYVQVPCIERNAVAALRALEAAILAKFLDNTNSKVSFDQVIDTMKRTGLDLNGDYRETAQGGLARLYKAC